MLTFAKCFITVPFCRIQAGSSIRALHFIAIIAGKQTCLVGNQAATYYVSIRWGLDSLARKPFSKKERINVTKPSVGNQKEVFFRSLGWLLRQGIVFPIAQCKGIRIPKCRKFFLWKREWALGFGIRYVAQGRLESDWNPQFRMRNLNPSSSDRESEIQSWIPLLGAILTCVSALGLISCK